MLDIVYKFYFKNSDEFKNLLKEINENIIEYRFMSLAGLNSNVL